MDMLGYSECSRGCESGWTLYLDHSAASTNPSHYREPNGFRDKRIKDKGVYRYQEEEEEEEEEGEEEEEDLSMVSDASSGPPNLNEDEACDDGFKQYSVSREAPLPIRAKKQRSRGRKGREDRKTASFLDDTASSPFINFCNSNFGVNNMNQASLESGLDYSQGFSATYFQGRPAFQDQLGFFQSSLSGNPIQNNQLGLI